MNINELCDIAYKDAAANGWHEGGIHVPEKLALVHSEVSEALEDYRTGKMETEVLESGKPVGFATEIADVVIRIADLAGVMGIDHEAEILRKMAYNRTRSHRHGGKRC